MTAKLWVVQHVDRDHPAHAPLRCSRESDPAAQIDLVLDRADGVINLCEMKFCREPYEITKSYDGALRHKTASFARETRTSKALHLTLVSPHGVKRNKYWGMVQAEITGDDLFS